MEAMHGNGDDRSRPPASTQRSFAPGPDSAHRDRRIPGKQNGEIFTPALSECSSPTACARHVGGTCPKQNRAVCTARSVSEQILAGRIDQPVEGLSPLTLKSNTWLALTSTPFPLEVGGVNFHCFTASRARAVSTLLS